MASSSRDPSVLFLVSHSHIPLFQGKTNITPFSWRLGTCAQDVIEIQGLESEMIDDERIKGSNQKETTFYEIQRHEAE